MDSAAKKTYDFIVCGGGTSGCVVAGRLAEMPNTSVLVLEAGPSSENLEDVDMVGGWPKMTRQDLDWHIVSQPGAGINGRRIELTRGKFVGGSSGCNGALCVRGTKHDVDDWKVPGWSGADFFNYMRKAETFESKPWFEPRPGAHGHNGYVATSPFDLAPISKLVLQSMQSQGLPFDADMFAHGERAHGCGHVVRTVSRGVRTTSADYITKRNRRSNVDIVTGAHVERVVLSRRRGGVVAVGVRAALSDGRVVEFAAAKEVIVSGGAYCSPMLLSRSGIGARSELEKHGIETVVDLPAVGKNLMDHPIVYLWYETDKPGLTTDAAMHHGSGPADAARQWTSSKTGVYSNSAFGVFAYARLDSRLADSPLWTSAPRRPGRDAMDLLPTQPNIELFSAECYGGPPELTAQPPQGKHVFCVLAELFGAKSRGSVTLASTDPTAPPRVDCGFLTHPLDAEVLAEGCRLAHDVVMRGSGTAPIVKGTWPPDAPFSKFKTRDEWVRYVRDYATTCYHASGTCAMGLASDPSAVVDEQLRVIGVSGLRVVDCSVIPLLGTCHTQMPAYGIGEKAADLIKAAWSGEHAAEPRVKL